MLSIVPEGIILLGHVLPLSAQHVAMHQARGVNMSNLYTGLGGGSFLFQCLLTGHSKHSSGSVAHLLHSFQPPTAPHGLTHAVQLIFSTLQCI